MGGSGGQKRSLDQGGGDQQGNKRQRASPVTPPAQEQLPMRGNALTLEEVQSKFEELQQQVRVCVLCGCVCEG